MMLYIALFFVACLVLVKIYYKSSNPQHSYTFFCKNASCNNKDCVLCNAKSWLNFYERNLEETCKKQTAIVESNRNNTSNLCWVLNSMAAVSAAQSLLEEAKEVFNKAYDLANRNKKTSLRWW
jgi:hypothetical protein